MRQSWSCFVGIRLMSINVPGGDGRGDDRGIRVPGDIKLMSINVPGGGGSDNSWGGRSDNSWGGAIWLPDVIPHRPSRVPHLVVLVTLPHLSYPVALRFVEVCGYWELVPNEFSIALVVV